MRLALTATLGSITWQDSDLDREALVFQYIVTGSLAWCLHAGDANDRPTINLQIGDTTYAVQAGGIDVNQFRLLLIFEINQEPGGAPYYLGFRKNGSAPWVLLDRYIEYSKPEEWGTLSVQEGEDRARAILITHYI